MNSQKFAQEIRRALKEGGWQTVQYRHWRESLRSTDPVKAAGIGVASGQKMAYCHYIPKADDAPNTKQIQHDHIAGYLKQRGYTVNQMTETYSDGLTTFWLDIRP